MKRHHEHHIIHTSEWEQSRIMQWLDKRTGLIHLKREALYEPIPGGARWAYIFGSGLLYILFSQIVTGVFLAMYYVASADHAHTTIEYITKQVTAGSFIRSLHSYGSSAMVVTLVLHMAQTYFFGSYKGRREILWLSGLILFAMIIGMAFTGYLLPWDQKAFFATAVGTNIAGEVPLIGDWLKSLMRGGTEMGTLTLSRFFVAHVFLIPACIFGFVGAHVFLFRKAGSAGPIDEDPIDPKKPTEQFYPKQVIMDIVFATILIGTLGLLSYFSPVELGPKASPADTQFLPRPEWYYLPIFQWLKYWSGQSAVIGIVIIPGIIAALLVALPFIDRRPERRPWKRPIASFSFAIILCGLIFLGWQSGHEDSTDPSVAKQLAKQEQETEKFMKATFEPETMGPPLLIAAPLSPDAAKGKKLFADNSCDGCHGDNGQGTENGPKLIGVSLKFDHDEMLKVLRNPTKKMRDGNMDPVELGDDDMNLLMAYLNSLK
ncbi:MAG: cytochrome b N-terminal domain-containing protein [Bacteroidota bacterium]|nr:cytochrome b N-terminal domain-containing protein [Bacteroidota bacterium]MDP4232445.1 cytochrome b N-terminal domain-containing protein [Bacteroidota bacterium]MDP4241581.1 cytochrome b N-terminal domain-containing protein [Bacteroidota bacterium]MDP4286325.1 cytochrome b N-terminal domain-containing protein [Bacteroidota bacterium]